MDAVVDRKFIDVGGIRPCYYQKDGSPPIVLFHGGNFGSPDLSDNPLDWDTIFDGMAVRYRVFAIDKIGQGRTDIPKRDED